MDQNHFVNSQRYHTNIEKTYGRILLENKAGNILNIAACIINVNNVVKEDYEVNCFTTANWVVTWNNLVN